MAGRGRPGVAFEVEVFEDLAAFPVGPAGDVAALDCEHVEDHEHDTDAVAAVEHSIAEPREAWEAVAAKRDELAVDRQAVRQRGELGYETGHVPAASADGAELAVSTGEAAEAVPLRFEGVVAARGKLSAAEKHRSGKSHSQRIVSRPLTDGVRGDSRSASRCRPAQAPANDR